MLQQEMKFIIFTAVIPCLPVLHKFGEIFLSTAIFRPNPDIAFESNKRNLMSFWHPTYKFFWVFLYFSVSKCVDYYSKRQKIYTIWTETRKLLFSVLWGQSTINQPFQECLHPFRHDWVEFLSHMHFVGFYVGNKEHTCLSCFIV